MWSFVGFIMFSLQHQKLHFLEGSEWSDYWRNVVVLSMIIYIDLNVLLQLRIETWENWFLLAHLHRKLKLHGMNTE